MVSKDVVLEERDLKNALVLGTGLTESIISSAMGFAKYPSINLDLDSTYASAIKTVSLKELLSFYENRQQQTKDSCFQPIFLETSVNEEYVKKNSRHYNIDFQPRVLYSRSISVEKMIEAGMDKYMDFRAISGIFWFDTKSEKWQTLPISKSAIHKDTAFDIKEKRDLFRLLHTCVALYSHTNPTKEDINSTNEFDKDKELNPEDLALYKEFEHKNCYEFLSKYTKSERLKNAFIYTIGNIQIDCKEVKEADESISTKKMLQNVFKFIKSAGVHSSFPYLYTNYGTGDIPQGFARVSGVMGSVYIIHPEIRIGNLTFVDKEQPEESKTGEKLIRLETSLAGEKKYLEFEYAVLNRDYEHLIPGFQNNNTESRRLLRVVIVVQDQGETCEYGSGPELYYVYPKENLLGNQQPVQIMVCNEYTYSVPTKHFVIYASSIVDNSLSTEAIEALAKRIKEFAVARCLRRIPKIEKEPEVKEPEVKEEEAKNEEGANQPKEEGTDQLKKEETMEPVPEPQVILYTGFLQRIRGKNQVGTHKNIYLVDDDDFGIDFDEYFERAQKGFHHLFGESRKMALSIKTSDVEFDVPEGHFEDEEDENHPVMKHLEALDKFRVTKDDETTKPESSEPQSQSNEPQPENNPQAENAELTEKVSQEENNA